VRGRGRRLAEPSGASRQWHRRPRRAAAPLPPVLCSTLCFPAVHGAGGRLRMGPPTPPCMGRSRRGEREEEEQAAGRFPIEQKQSKSRSTTSPNPPCGGCHAPPAAAACVDLEEASSREVWGRDPGS
jgi:hypothetical protein